MKTTDQAMNSLKSISVLVIFSLIVFTIYSVEKKVLSTIHRAAKHEKATLNNTSIEKWQNKIVQNKPMIIYEKNIIIIIGIYNITTWLC